MSRRINVTVAEDQYRALKRSSRSSGASISELVRRAVSKNLGLADHDAGDEIEAIRQAAGLWADRGDEIYDQIRASRLDFRTRKE